MAITANDLLVELNQRLGPFAALANLQSASAWAMREIGFATANPIRVTDTDLIPVTDDDLNELFDYAEFSAGKRILGNLDPVQLRAISIEEDADGLRRAWDKRVKEQADSLKSLYGYGLPSLSFGEVNLLFEGDKRRGQHDC